MTARLLVALLALSACAETPGPNASGKCDASGVQAMVGQLDGAALHKRALRRSGARTLRVIKPGTMVTMDYREDRLNIHLDAQGRVTDLTCG